MPHSRCLSTKYKATFITGWRRHWSVRRISWVAVPPRKTWTTCEKTSFSLKMAKKAKCWLKRFWNVKKRQRRGFFIGSLWHHIRQLQDRKPKHHPEAVKKLNFVWFNGYCLTMIGKEDLNIAINCSNLRLLGLSTVPPIKMIILISLCRFLLLWTSTNTLLDSWFWKHPPSILNRN